MISIVVPMYNEEERLSASLDKIVAFMGAHHPDYEVVLVDDGSTDGTLALARRRAEGCPQVRIESYGANRGKGYAVRTGIERSRGDVVLFSDADLSTPIAEIEKMLAAVARGADVAIGTRAHPESDVQVRQPFYRDSGGKLFNLFVRLFLLPGLGDTQCGFKILRRAAVLPLVQRMRVDRFAFDVELLYLARQAQLNIVEVPVVWVNAPGSRVRMRHAVAAFVDVVRIWNWHHPR